MTHNRSRQAFSQLVIGSGYMGNVGSHFKLIIEYLRNQCYIHVIYVWVYTLTCEHNYVIYLQVTDKNRRSRLIYYFFVKDSEQYYIPLSPLKIIDPCHQVQLSLSTFPLPSLFSVWSVLGAVMHYGKSFLYTGF